MSVEIMSKLIFYYRLRTYFMPLKKLFMLFMFPRVFLDVTLVQLRGLLASRNMSLKQTDYEVAVGPIQVTREKISIT